MINWRASLISAPRPFRWPRRESQSTARNPPRISQMCSYITLTPTRPASDMFLEEAIVPGDLPILHHSAHRTVSPTVRPETIAITPIHSRSDQYSPPRDSEGADLTAAFA